MLISDTNYNCIQRTTKTLQKRPNRSKIKKILKASLRRNERTGSISHTEEVFKE